jgi:hypothetical protein
MPLFRKLDGQEMLALEALSPLLDEMRSETLESLAVCKDADVDVFLKAKAQAFADLMLLPLMQKSMEKAEADARTGGNDERSRPDEPPGWWGRIRRGVGRRGTGDGPAD